MSRPRSESGGPAAVASNRRRRALTYGDLPPEMKDAIQDYLRFTNESLRAAVAEYFEDKAATERRYGKIGTWDVGRVTDMSRLFYDRTRFNEARAGVGRRRDIFSTRVEGCRIHTVERRRDIFSTRVARGCRRVDSTPSPRRADDESRLRRKLGPGTRRA